MIHAASHPYESSCEDSPLDDIETPMLAEALGACVAAKRHGMPIPYLHLVSTLSCILAKAERDRQAQLRVYLSGLLYDLGIPGLSAISGEIH